MHRYSWMGNNDVKAGSWGKLFPTFIQSRPNCAYSSWNGLLASRFLATCCAAGEMGCLSDGDGGREEHRSPGKDCQEGLHRDARNGPVETTAPPLSGTCNRQSLMEETKDDVMLRSRKKLQPNQNKIGPISTRQQICRRCFCFARTHACTMSNRLCVPRVCGTPRNGRTSPQTK